MRIESTLKWTSAERCLLGENPLWDAQTSCLLWIDVADPAVYRLREGTVTRFAMPKPVAALFLGDAHTVVVAMRQSFALLDLGTGALTLLEAVAPPTSEERFNDGRCDALGRVWISTMDRKVERPIGSLVRIDGDNVAHVIPTDAKLGNGVCFSPDGTTLYFSDTSNRRIYRHAAAGGAAMPVERTLLATLDDSPGRPDGCSVDTEGCLWSARVGGWRIDRYAPDGRLIGYLETPVSHPTHCTFGGPGLSTLYVTSSRFPADAASFRDQALAGAVLAFDLPARGMPEARVNAATIAAWRMGVAA